MRPPPTITIPELADFIAIVFKRRRSEGNINNISSSSESRFRQFKFKFRASINSFEFVIFSTKIKGGNVFFIILGDPIGQIGEKEKFFSMVITTDASGYKTICHLYFSLRSLHQG